MNDVCTDTIVAIPCYADRVLPRFDQAHQFLVANIDLNLKSITSQEILNCTVPAPKLASWLAEQGVNGVLCSGIHQQYQLQLQRLGLWLTWGVAGELNTVLQNWLQTM